MSFYILVDAAQTLDLLVCSADSLDTLGGGGNLRVTLLHIPKYAISSKGP